MENAQCRVQAFLAWTWSFPLPSKFVWRIAMQKILFKVLSILSNMAKAAEKVPRTNEMALARQYTEEKQYTEGRILLKFRTPVVRSLVR